MVRTRKGKGTGRGTVDPLDRMSANLESLMARMEQQQAMLMRQQQMIEQLQENMAKRDQDKEEEVRERSAAGARAAEVQASLAGTNPQVAPQESHPSASFQVDTSEAPQSQPFNTHAIVQFRKYNPPEFDGELKVEKAESWLMEMEKIFEILEVSSQQKVRLATFMLRREADHWWRSTRLILQGRDTPLTWESFLEEFHEKYFPRSIRDDKETEFITLKQEEGDLSVDQYVAKFIELSRYSSYLKRYDDEGWKTEKLERGLKPEIRDRVIPQQIRSFNKLVEVARVTEANLKRMAAPRSEFKRPRVEIAETRGTKRPSRGTWVRKGGSKATSQASVAQPATRCSRCGREHGSQPCPMRPAKCFRCGQTGHFYRECPQQPLREAVPTTRP